MKEYIVVLTADEVEATIAALETVAQMQGVSRNSRRSAASVRRDWLKTVEKLKNEVRYADGSIAPSAEESAELMAKWAAER